MSEAHDDPRDQLPPLCGKPVRNMTPPCTSEADTAGPVANGAWAVMEIVSLCLLSPEHEGPCMDAKVLSREQPRTIAGTH